ncbi:transcription factor that binds to CRE motif [Knufia obscura]|uniref:Transcription factor that binds to CRE motif n=2 Tax=Knufia TaxID=430999 RepID=A0AAN8EIY4_9EURO|nr:transcription factor that binds to CRE motif [Knufia obscura]KAK5955030.1 transcription factor that binds to CRE motif [Knufia fluminis]
MTAYVDASEFSQLGFSRQDSPAFDYPTPSNSSDAGTSVKDEPNKKKRKAWGQPVPEIVQILPPRKRAKTAEEKEQRKNERILRNRRAADKSRQRQKAQQAGLEQQNKDLLSENAQLKEVLRKAGIQFTFTPPPSVDYSVSDDQLNETTPQPVFSEPSPPPSVQEESPCLAPQVDLSQSLEPTPSVLDTGLTQYPAVVLCDLQCQPILDRKLGQLQPIPLVNTILTLIHYLTIATTFSTSMHSPISRLFRTLEVALSTTSHQLEAIVLNNFQLIHILISMPSYSTQPAIFRIKLLSRLLARNPSLAPLLMTAADRALQQKLAEGDWTDDDDRRWAVASLMTINWSIRWLCKEHYQMRAQLRNGTLDRDSLYEREKSGVDCTAVERYYRLFDELDPKPTIRVVSPGVSTLVASQIEAH